MNLLDPTLLFAQDAPAPGGGLIAVIIGLVLYLAILVFFLATFWKLFAKAGKPGWLGIIPIVNAIVLLDIVGRPLWWFILFLIPIVNIVVGVIVMIDLAQRFGKGVGFALGLMFLPFIFYPVLAFGGAQYQPAGGPAEASAPTV